MAHSRCRAAVPQVLHLTAGECVSRRQVSMQRAISAAGPPPRPLHPDRWPLARPGVIAHNLPGLARPPGQPWTAQTSGNFSSATGRPLAYDIALWFGGGLKVLAADATELHRLVVFLLVLGRARGLLLSLFSTSHGD